MKRCSKCSKEKKLIDFYQRRNGREAGKFYEKCKECYKERGRFYYHQNRETQLKLALLRKRKYKELRSKFINTLKKGTPCADCKGFFPSWVMDFDHREGEIKVASVSRLAITDTVNMDRIKAEIKKCDLVCANCHRTRTYIRMH